MINRERFMLDLDSEGFPVADHSPFGEINIGKTPNVALAQALLVDYRCLECEPVEKVCLPQDYSRIEQRALAHANPEGWQEVDGVRLPPIEWGTVINNIGVEATVSLFSHMESMKQLHQAEVLDARQLVQAADRGVLSYDEEVSNVPVEMKKAVAEHFLNHEAFFGWKR